MKPLEPGCRAIVIFDNDNPANVGKEVVCHYVVEDGTPIKFQFSMDGVMRQGKAEIMESAWYVTGNVETFVSCSGKRIEDGSPITFNGLVDCFIGNDGTEYNGCFVSKQLMRIDGFSDEDKQNDREQEVGRGLLIPVGFVAWKCISIYN